MKTKIPVLLFGLLAATISCAAHAACTSPDGVAGQMTWFAPNTTLKFCDDTTWVDLRAGDSSYWAENAGSIYYSGGSVGIGTTTPVGKLQVVGGNITPAVNYGLDWPDNPGGGAGDNAYIRYYVDGGTEDTRLEIGISNDKNDDLYFRSGDITFDTTAASGGPGHVYIPGGNVGIGMTSGTTPVSTLHVPDNKYAQFENNNAGAPPTADCDGDTKRGRLAIDTANNRLYLCMGATRGWDYMALAD